MLSLNKSYKNRKFSLTIHCKYKYFDSTVQRAEDRGQKFYFCQRLPFAVNVKLNLSIISDNTERGSLKVIPQYCIAHLYCARFSRHQRAHMSACSCKTWRICLDFELCHLKNGHSAPTSMGTPTFFLVIVINLS